jgi:predicted nucleotidyltransferase
MSQTIDLEPILERAVKALVEAIDPEQIILFGSAARGEFGPGSDLDFLLVVDEARFGGEMQRRGRMALRHLGVPKDIFYSFPERFAGRKDLIGTIEEPAHREGRVLYARG